MCQCSGNRRGLSQPHVPGVEWGLGAMGNAVWRGVRLKDLLARAGLRKEAVEIVLDGADGPVVEKTPDFVKSIPVWKALDENTIIAHQMNSQPRRAAFFIAPSATIGGAWTGITSTNTGEASAPPRRGPQGNRRLRHPGERGADLLDATERGLRFSFAVLNDAVDHAGECLDEFRPGHLVGVDGRRTGVTGVMRAAATATTIAGPGRGAASRRAIPQPAARPDSRPLPFSISAAAFGFGPLLGASAR